MDPVTGGALIMGGSSLLGGALNNRAIRRANERNLQMQEEFARNGIRWRVEDAKAAGIHPLYALGASTMSPSYSVQAETGIGTGLQNMGQDLSRAMRAGMGVDELQESIMKEQLTNQKLHNELLGIQINKARQPATIPLNFSGVQDSFFDGQSPLMQNKPVQREHSSPFDPARSAGAVSDIGFVYTQDGGLAVLPSKDAKERLEDQLIPEAMWAWRNQIQPFFTGVEKKPDQREFPLPLGYEWKWNAVKQGFYPVKMKNAGKSIPSHGMMPERGQYVPTR